MNLEINKKAVQYIPLSNYYDNGLRRPCSDSYWITNESFPYTNPSLDRAEMDRLIAALYSSTQPNSLNFLISKGTTDDKTDYNWTLDKDVNPLVNKEINYCQNCGSDLGDNGKCNCTPKEVINEIVYTPTKSEESVIYYTPDKKETVVNYISAVDPVSMGSSVPIVTTYTLTTSNDNQLYDYCKENELTLLIDFANNKVIVDNQHFTSDSIEKSIEMALSFIE